jgi:hypothetical protein
MKKDKRGINIASKPTGDKCVECMASPKGWWLHLRRWGECGHIGCDSSPSQHASKHAAATGHPVHLAFSMVSGTTASRVQHNVSVPVLLLRAK